MPSSVSMRPIGPGYPPKASSAVVWILVTVRASKISPPNTTSAPRPAENGCIATCEAAHTLNGPSQLGSREWRMLPVTTTGRSVCTVRCR